jgi:hypothetical protein
MLGVTIAKINFPVEEDQQKYNTSNLVAHIKRHADIIAIYEDNKKQDDEVMEASLY